MSVRPPNLLRRNSPLDGGIGILDGEIMAEMAASIGRAGRSLETSLAALEALEPEDQDAREKLLQDAAKKAWALFTQYELCGLSSQSNLVKRYRIPPEVVVRVGVIPRD